MIFRMYLLFMTYALSSVLSINPMDTSSQDLANDIKREILPELWGKIYCYYVEKTKKEHKEKLIAHSKALFSQFDYPCYFFWRKYNSECLVLLLDIRQPQTFYPGHLFMHALDEKDSVLTYSIQDICEDAEIALYLHCKPGSLDSSKQYSVKIIRNNAMETKIKQHRGYWDYLDIESIFPHAWDAQRYHLPSAEGALVYWFKDDSYKEMSPRAKAQAVASMIAAQDAKLQSNECYCTIL